MVFFDLSSRRRGSKTQAFHREDKPKAVVARQIKIQQIPCDSHREETVTDKVDRPADCFVLRCLLWFSTLIGVALVLLSFASSLLLITFPLEHRYDGPFLNTDNPKVATLIKTAWGLLSTILLLFIQQICLTALVKRVTVSKMSDQLLGHFKFLLKLRIFLGALTMVVLLMGVMSVFIESQTMRGAVLMGGALTVVFWYWATREPLISNKAVHVYHKNEDTGLYLV